MNRVLRTCCYIAIVNALIFCCLAAVFTEPADQANRAAHRISMTTPLGEEAGCSATAVGERTILTAAHCVLPSDRLQVDEVLYVIESMLFDRADHVLIVLQGAKFEERLSINERVPQPGDRVQMWGNPGHTVHLYREGLFEKVIAADKQPADHDATLFLYLLPSFPGDSGSGLVIGNEVVEVLSLVNMSGEAACMRLQFTPDQLMRIR